MVFTGTQQISISQSRITSPPVSIDFRLHKQESSVTVLDEQFNLQAELNGLNFSVDSQAIPVDINGSPCTYSINYSGTFTGSSVQGTISGSLGCERLPASLSGSFTATLSPDTNVDALPSVSVIFD